MNEGEKDTQRRHLNWKIRNLRVNVGMEAREGRHLKLGEQLRVYDVFKKR